MKTECTKTRKFVRLPILMMKEKKIATFMMFNVNKNRLNACRLAKTICTLLLITCISSQQTLHMHQ